MTNRDNLVAARVTKRFQERQAGLLAPPPAMIKRISAWVRSTYAAHVWAKKLPALAYLAQDVSQRQDPSHFIKEELIQLQLLVKEVSSLASAPKGYKTKVTHKFKMDLSGWPYLSKTEQDYVEGALPIITVALLFKNRKTFHGQWNGQKRVLEVDVPAEPSTVRQFQKTLVELHDTLIHELGHLGQLALLLAKKPGGGLPSKSLIDTDYSPEGFFRGPAPPGKPQKLEYLLHSQEFYPLLLDGIRVFRREVRNIPLKDRADAARIWVGEKPKDNLGPALIDWRQRVPRSLWAPNDLMKTLKSKRPKLWAKAVKEFYKGIQSVLD